MGSQEGGDQRTETWDSLRGEKIRIISARRATQRESQQYPENP